MVNNDPWHTLTTDWPKVRVFIRLLHDQWGQTVWDGDRPHIELAHDLGPIQQRCTLAHEIQHLEKGRPCSSFCDDGEREVVEATARWLLPDVAEIGELLRDHHLTDTAAALEVTRRVLADRLACMTLVEERELARFLEPGTAHGQTRAADGPRRSAARPPHSCG